jgi:hypothetical protein
MRRCGIVVGSLWAGLGVAALAAQSYPPWGAPTPARLVSLDVARPSWDGADLDAASGLLYGALRVPVSGALSVVGELPWARFGVTGGSGSVVGNLYVGLEQGPAGPSGLTADLGVRLPTSSQSGDLGGEAAVLAAFSDFDRAEAWLDELWAARGHVGYRHTSPGGFAAGFTIGGTLWASEQGEDEVVADYRGHAAYRQQSVVMGAELTGRAVLTESGSFGERTIHQLTLGVGVAAGAVWPRAFLRVPLDADLKDFGLNQVFGIAIDWRF